MNAIHQIDKPIEFYKIFAASFISQSGSYFMTLSLAAATFVLTDSISGAAFVMVLSYLPAIFLSGKAGKQIDQKLSVKMLLFLELFSALTSVFCGFLLYYEQYLLLIIPLCFRSYLTFATRAAMSKWLKVISPKEKQGIRIKIFLLGFFLSTTVAGILAGIALKGDIHDGIFNVIIIDFVTYMISMLVIYSLYETKEIRDKIRGGTVNINRIEAGIINSLKEIFQNSILKKTFIAVVVSQAVFQGAYQAFISIIPSQFGLDISGISGFQIAASIGLIIAFLLLWGIPNFLEEKGKAIPLRTILTGIGGLIGIVSVVSFSNFTGSILSFGILTFFYELIWLANRTSFFVEAPLNHVARYQFLLDAIAAIAMSLCTIGYAVFMEIIEFKIGSLLFLATSLLVFGVLVFIVNKKINN